MTTHTRFFKNSLQQSLRIIGALAVAAILSLVLTRVYLEPGVPYTHDGENHLARFANYAVAVREGQIPPRFAPNLLNHYGYPVFNYNYPLANILSLPLGVIDVPYESIFKLLVTSSLVSGLIGTWYWVRSLRAKRWVAALASLSWLSQPYLVTAVMYRGTIGEVMALGMVPWLFWSVEQWRRRWRWSELRALQPQALGLTALLVLLWSAFLLVHNVAVLLFVPTILLYAVARWWGSKHRSTGLSATQLFGYIAGIFGGILGSLWFWLPALLEKRLVILDQVDLSTSYAAHAPRLQQLISSPQQFGFSYPGPLDTLSFALGGATILILVAVSIQLLTAWWQHKQTPSTWLSVLTAIGIGAALMQLPFMMPLWEYIPFIRFVQFPWRLTMVIAAITPALLIWVSRDWGRWERWGIVSLVLVQLVIASRVMPVDRIDKQDIDYTLFAETSTTQNENTAIGFSYVEVGDWEARPSTLSGSATFKDITWRGSNRQYTATVTDAPTTIVEPTMWFPGWQTRVDRERISITPEEAAGRLAYTIEEAGTYRISSTFTQQTAPRIIGNSISLLTLSAASLTLLAAAALYSIRRTAD